MIRPHFFSGVSFKSALMTAGFINRPLNAPSPQGLPGSNDRSTFDWFAKHLAVDAFFVIAVRLNHTARTTALTGVTLHRRIASPPAVFDAPRPRNAHNASPCYAFSGDIQISWTPFFRAGSPYNAAYRRRGAIGSVHLSLPGIARVSPEPAGSQGIACRLGPRV